MDGAKFLGQKLRDMSVLIPRVMSGTVVTNYALANETFVTLDTAPDVPVPAQAIVGILAKGTRVKCMSYPPRGLLILGVLQPEQGFLQPPHIEVLTGTGTFTTPTGIILLGLLIEAQAPGGAGGGAAATIAGEGSAGGGAGGGGYARKWLTPLEQGVSQTYAIGAPGAGVAGATGGAGGSARYGPVLTPLCRATGGGGGVAGGATAVAGSPVPAGTGGLGSDGDLLLSGGAGSLGVRSTVSRGGSGGNGILGGGARTAGQDSPGAKGGDYGGGGSGANNDGAGTVAEAGGEGGEGAIVATLYYRD